MPKIRIIKRYANRKLYDTQHSCYVTLQDIAHMIRGGDEVQVVDNKTGEDLTQVTLAQIIFEAEKRGSFMSLSLLRGLIQAPGGALSGLAREGVHRAQAKAQDVRQQAHKLRTDLEGRIDRVMNKPSDGSPLAAGVRELMQRARRNFDELQHGVGVALRGPTGTVTRYANLGREMEEIQQRMAELEKRLSQFPDA